MDIWGWILVVAVAWCILAAVVAFIVGRAVRIRDEKERGPRGVPDFVPGSVRGLADHGGAHIDLAEHRRPDHDR
ncbi:hypothetical protein [Gordonia aurantiaca]|uniref:hypothetical protein n=1 Tax=Gordonia sp. B21 TaxID=3151852 RepID=UPI0032642F55